MISLLMAMQACEVLLDEPGKVRTYPFTLDKPAYVEAVAILPPIPLTLTFKYADGELMQRPPYMVWPAGDYTLEVSSTETSPDPILVDIQTSDPLDPYEPNDSLYGPAPVELPLGVRVRLFAAGDMDWFRFRVARSGVLGMQVDSHDPAAEVHFQLLNGAGEFVYATSNQWGHRGMRYVAVEPGDYVFAVWEKNVPDAFYDVRIGLYGRRSDEGRGRFVGIGLSADSPDYKELSLVGEASGAPLRETLTAEEIEREAREAIAARTTAATPEPSGGPWGWIAVGIAAAAGAAGAWAWRRRRGRPSSARG